MAKIEMPVYSTLKRDRSIEIRQYSSVIVAAVEVSGERNEAINNGFRILADYIFGNNSPKKTIAMTAPVIQRKGQIISMTAPVAQSKKGAAWRVQFTMPSQYSLESLPKPNNPEIQIEKLPPTRVVVIRFSGIAGDKSLRRHQDELDTYIRANNLKAAGDPIYAYYDPPWTLPFFRRNEIMRELMDAPIE